jgi:hypothetical protein
VFQRWGVPKGGVPTYPLLLGLACGGVEVGVETGQKREAVRGTCRVMYDPDVCGFRCRAKEGLERRAKGGRLEVVYRKYFNKLCLEEGIRNEYY